MWGMPTYFIFGLPALLLALYAQWRVSSTYRKYLRVPATGGMTGLQVAHYLLRATGLAVKIERRRSVDKPLRSAQ